MKRVYVAGPYSATNTLNTFNNMRKGIRVATELLLNKYAPFCPFLDYHFQLSLSEGEQLVVEDYYEYSLAWLEVSDCLLVLPNSEHSVGTQQEIIRAQELKIPLYYNLDELKKNER